MKYYIPNDVTGMILYGSISTSFQSRDDLCLHKNVHTKQCVLQRLACVVLTLSKSNRSFFASL